MTYTVRVDDNFHYRDPDKRYTHGEYETLEDALKAAKAIVDDFLAATHTPGMSAEDLSLTYIGFGEDPFILGPQDCRFSAWAYARARCELICATIN
jgi:hypothetical protein